MSHIFIMYIVTREKFHYIWPFCFIHKKYICSHRSIWKFRLSKTSDEKDIISKAENRAQGTIFGVVNVDFMQVLYGRYKLEKYF